MPLSVTKWTEKRLQSFATDWNQGMDTMDLAEKYGISTRSVPKQAGEMRREGYPMKEGKSRKVSPSLRGVKLERPPRVKRPPAECYCNGIKHKPGEHPTKDCRVSQCDCRKLLRKAGAR